MIQKRPKKNYTYKQNLKINRETYPTNYELRKKHSVEHLLSLEQSTEGIKEFALLIMKEVFTAHELASSSLTGKLPNSLFKTNEMLQEKDKIKPKPPLDQNKLNAIKRKRNIKLNKNLISERNAII